MTGAELKQVRKVLRLKQTELAERLDVHPLTISRWERGTGQIPRATAELLKLWAKQKRQQRTGKV
jgi:transcriptional regulator with XRE-family HTH domain